MRTSSLFAAILYCVCLRAQSFFPPQEGNDTAPRCPLAQSPPTQYICGENNLSRPGEEDLGPDAPYEVNYATCRDLCLASSWCSGFRFNARGSRTKGPLCLLLQRPVIKEAFSRSSRPNSYLWSRYCWNCKEQCDQIAGTNLLGNPGFEGSATAISPWDADPDIQNYVEIVTPGYKSRQALAVLGNRNNVLLGQIFQLCSGTLYHLSFDYKVMTTASDVSITVNVGNLAIMNNEQLVNLSSTSWGTISGIFIDAPEALGLMVTLYAPKPTRSRNLLIDNFKITPYVLNTTGVASAPEMIVNGGFESGKLSPWTNFADGNPNPGFQQKVKMPGIHSSYGYHNTHGGVSLYQNVTGIISGATYLFSFNYKFPGFTECSFMIGINESEDNSTSISFNFQPGPVKPAKYFEIAIIAPRGKNISDGTLLSFYCGTLYDAPSEVDNISLKQIET